MKIITAIALVIAASSFNVQMSQAAASIPPRLQGTWCNDHAPGSWRFDYNDEDCDSDTKTMTVTSTGYQIGTDACQVTQANAFDYFIDGKHKDPWSPGYQFKFLCTSQGQAPEFYTQEWTQSKLHLDIKLTKAATSKTDNFCIQKTRQQGFDGEAAKRMCNSRNYVTNKNEYGWGYDRESNTYFKMKGAGARSKRDVVVE
jgi:hypothetical protein